MTPPLPSPSEHDDADQRDARRCDEAEADAFEKTAHE